MEKYSGGHFSNMEKMRENELLNAECQEIPSSALSVKATYCRLLRPIIEKPTSQENFSRFLGLTEINRSEVFMTPRRVTIESSLRIFQYNLLNNCVYLNNRLSKFDQNISPLCSLCNEVLEEMLHFFVYVLRHKNYGKIYVNCYGDTCSSQNRHLL